MSTLLDTETSTYSFGAELQTSMAAVRLQIRWFGVSRSAATRQKFEVADIFNAESRFLSLRKRLFDTTHPAWRKLLGVRYNIMNTWKHSSLLYPEPGIRFVRRRNLDAFTESMNSLRDDLRDAERELDNHFEELKEATQVRLGRLYNSHDYPESMVGMFDVAIDFPSVEPPEYLRHLSPALYRQESERIRNRFDEAVRLAEESFFTELSNLVSHLTDRLSGSEDGKPKIFRDTVVTNMNDFFERFRRLNIGSSEELDHLVDEVRRIVGNTSAGELRNSGTLRQHVATELSRVQSQLDGLMVDRPRRNLIRRNGGSNGNRD